MAADLVPIRLTVTAGDRYTLWAPAWRDGGDEWEGLLGDDDSLFGFAGVAELAAFVRTGGDNDLSDHPGWADLQQANAHKLTPAKRNRYDLIAVEELIAAKPTKKSVRQLANIMEIVSTIGAICELSAVTKFFNGNPSLGLLVGGVENFEGRAGRKRWNGIADVIGRNWENVLTALDELISTPEVDAAAVTAAEAQLAEPAPVEEETAEEAAAETDEDAKPAKAKATAAESETGRAHGDRVVLGGDKDFWEKVGIDPIRIMTGSATFYTLRCYLGDDPVFLGRNGRISVFGSERALARYLADEHDHDLSDLATYDDIRTAATDGSLSINVTEDNVYVLSELAEDLADGPDAVDREQLELAVEFVRDVGSYAEDGIVAEALAGDRPLGRLVDHILDPASAEEPAGPFLDAVKQWEQLEKFVDSRLRRE